MAFGSVPSADATIDIAGNLTGPLTVNGQFNGNLCADNLFGGSEPLPPNIHLGPPIGLSAQICGATASACAAVAAAASDESPVKPKSRYISFVPGSCQSGDPPEPCAYAIRIGMTKLHHVGHCSQTLSTTCNIDAQCPAGEVCVIARCSITGAPCTYTSDCGQSGGACVGYPSGRCTLPESQPACIVDEDCSGGTCVRTPPPDLSAHQGQWRYVNQVPDTLSRCCNPNSNPLSCNTAVSCDSNANCAGLGLNTHCVKQLCPDSTAFGTFFPCAKTGCTPEYRDWAGETGGRALHVTGSEIVPSSVYHLHAIGQACAEPAPNWANYSSALAVATNEWSNTDNQGNVASAADLGWVVDKVKDKVGAAIKPVAHLRTIELNPLSAVNASDIGRANDAVKGRGYPFEICDCVPDIICGRERCFDDDGNKRCVGSQTCVDGYCRDACMRCTQPQP